MEIESGKFYRTRDGRLAYVGVVLGDAISDRLGVDASDYSGPYGAWGVVVTSDGRVVTSLWSVEGRSLHQNEHECDLIEEIDGPPTVNVDSSPESGMPSSMEMLVVNGDHVVGPSLARALDDWIGGDDLLDVMKSDDRLKSFSLDVHHVGTMHRHGDSYVM